jgi:hypothetical protein
LVVFAIVGGLALTGLPDDGLLTTSAQSPQMFRNLKYFANADRGDVETDAVLVFNRDQFILRSAGDGRNLTIISFTRIRAARYSFSKNPPWRTGVGLPNVFSTSNKHWLLVEGDNDFALMMLAPNNYREVIASFETRARSRVEIVQQVD